MQAQLQTIADQVTATAKATADLTARVTAVDAALQAQITTLQAQIAAGTPLPQADVQTVLDGLTAIQTSLAGVDATVTPGA